MLGQINQKYLRVSSSSINEKGRNAIESTVAPVILFLRISDADLNMVINKRLQIKLHNKLILIDSFTRR